MENKLALIEVKVMLPANFKPRTVTYRAVSQMEKASEKEYVLKRAEELFTAHVLELAAIWKLKKEDLKIRASDGASGTRLYSYGKSGEDRL